MEEQKVILSENLEQALTEAIRECGADRRFVLVDDTTEQLCLPVVAGFDCMKGVEKIVIGAGDEHKTLATLTHVWNELQRLGASRHSLLINLGGGMVTDLGGFAASTFKRGMSLINIPTTLLAMVDASVGGKTGINFGGLKNEIGVFRNASSVILDAVFLKTLDRENILSGYAEMLKHGLIYSEEWRVKSGEFATAQQSTAVANSTLYTLNSKLLNELLTFDVEQPDLLALGRMVADSVKVKQHVVTEDPLEQGLRKALNLGHTMGHAFESLALTRHPVLHGYAVAWGLVCELYLSTIKTGFPVGTMRQVVRFILEHYGRMDITCDDYPTLLELMTHDKKNTAGKINFTLLHDVGDLALNQTATKEEIEEALDFYREGQ